MARSVKQATPLSVRLTQAERDNLITRAGGLSLSEFVKQVLFDGAPPVHSGLAVANRTLLAHLLATLGASNIAPNLDTLAREAEYGTLAVDEETIKAIHQASDDIRLMHNALMRGLGKKERAPSRRQREAMEAAKAFNDAADPEDQE